MARRRADHYTRRAKAQGFEARSVFKLQEIDRRFQVLRGAKRVVDLGCHPGSWSQLVARRPGVALVGVDIQETPSYPGTFLQGSIYEVDPEAIRGALGGPADLVLSDMAPSTTGARLKDHVDQIELVRGAWALAQELLVPGGTIAFKVFEGEDAPALVQAIRPAFDKIKRLRPSATRKESREVFLVGLSFTPVPDRG